MKVKKLLVISIRDECFDDFLNIAKRVNRLDSSIGILIRNGIFHPSEIPLQYQNIPLLTLYLVNPPDFLPVRGHTLCVKDLGKLDEYTNFVAAGVAIPKVKPYIIGETVDPAEWGDFVVLKPVHSSHAIGNVLVPTNWLTQIERNRIPATHPLASSPYLLQQFVDTGSHAMSYRVINFLGQPLVCISWRRTRAIKYPDTLDEIFSNESFTSNFKQEKNMFDEREFKIANDEEVVKFSSQVFNAHPDLPLQGIDIVRDEKSRKLYVLENNSGGNVWTFSNAISPTLKAIGRKALVTQFMAFDRAAEILVKKTHELAR
jgi:hypothetical protein